MAGGYGGQLVALDLNPSGFDVGQPLEEANQIQAGRLQNQGSALNLAVQKSLYGARSALINASGQPQGVGTTQAPQPPAPTPSSLIYAAAAKAKDPDSWDQAMSQLAQNGTPEAGQFVGRYTPRLQSSVLASYAPPAAAAPAGGGSPLAAPQGGAAGPVSPLAATAAPTSPLAAGSAPAAPGGAVSPLAASASPAVAGGGSGSPLASLSPEQQQAWRTMSIMDPAGTMQMLSNIARQKYAQTGDPNDLRADPTLQKAAYDALQAKTTAAKEQYAQGADYLGRAASQAQQIPDGPQRVAFWQSTLQQGLHDGQLTPDMAQNHAQYPSDQMLKLTQAGALTIADQYRVSGQEAGNISRATLGADLTKIAATGAQSRLTQAAAPFNLTPGDQRFSPDGTNLTPTGAGGAAPAGGGSPALPGTGSGAPAIPGVAPAVAPGQPGAHVVAAGTSLGTAAQQKAQAEQFVKYQGEQAESAAKAVTSNTDWDNMRADSQTWQQGKFADSIGDAKSYLVSMADQLGLDPGKYTQQVGDWQAFSKNAGALLRDAAHAVSSRVGVQEMQLVSRSLPSDVTSANGFKQVADQMQGVNDFQIAKNAAAANFQGSQPQFEAQFDKNVSPVAFIVHRMAPADYATFANNLKKTDAGKAELSKIISGMQYADQNGLFQALGQ